MNKSLKHILLDIARMSYTHQKWLLNQLSPESRHRLNQHQGEALLEQAQRFSAIATPMPPARQPLPTWCDALRQMPPRFIAIILAEGTFDWQQTFLNTCDERQQIERLLHHEIPLMTRATQSFVATTWHKSFSFSNHMECIHG
jgi:hypothetical protein